MLSTFYEKIIGISIHVTSDANGNSGSDLPPPVVLFDGHVSAYKIPHTMMGY
jgi:hypothetical protein